MLKLRDEAMEILAPYVPGFNPEKPNDYELNSSVRKMVEDRAAKRAEKQRHEQLAADIQQITAQMQMLTLSDHA